MSTEPAQSSSSQPAPARSACAEQKQKFTTPRSLLVDAILVVVFFAFMFPIIRTHVQSENPAFILLWGGGATACLSAVFWLAIQMFRIVLRAQLAENRK